MKTEPELVPIYGAKLIKMLPLGDKGLQQMMPSRKDLEAVRLQSERTAAGYEVLLDHYRKALELMERLTDDIETNTNNDEWPQIVKEARDYLERVKQ